ncbi:CBS domain-containing protein [Azospirillum sp. RWY-5-1]|uniref:CBS domain-containing protein n=1 Tax=Azospirillum oleiclasticum TaxID=2735135 RepID=A0ABX2T677_9PROT|nr:DUF294 nucleotidyltransferase-like domain-containing protein [Azospirillum oleiclasticum]NYZ11552.1 CBS domain-containing protein [Azospirillum oleiclasticum]NYZ18713.1 CBS domain-containing protein [Azospirillum oleiclasticum]
MQMPVLARIDAYPYRHRLAEVMTAPVVTAPGDQSLGEAAGLMDRLAISSLLVTDPVSGAVAGIVTERDVLRAVARRGAAALAEPLSAFMSGPVQGLPGDRFVYQALGRMDRLGVRHLAVTDGRGRPVGIVTARSFLRQRAGEALALGDRIQVAEDAAGIAAVRNRLPDLAAALAAEGVPALDTAAVIAELLRDMTARAAELAEREVTAARGPAPAPWCVLVLGSAGRGETLLAFDQDNALIHAGDDADDAWYADMAERMVALLDAGGVPRCRGGVMASNPAWRHSAAGWRGIVEHWVNAARPQDLLEVDVFFDLHPVHGDRDFAESLRRDALTHARDVGFLKNLGAQLDAASPPLTILGRLRTEEGRVDLKLGALWPVAAAARVLALRHGVTATGTMARLERLACLGVLAEGDRADLQGLYAMAARLVLDQQVADARVGVVPSPRIDPTRLDRATRRRLCDALRIVGRLADVVRDGLVAVRMSDAVPVAPRP